MRNIDQSNKTFNFGENWKFFLNSVDDQSINGAVISLKKILQVDNLNEKNFLDIGSGSGLFSLAAIKMGAKVKSFDYDPQSVECSEILREKFNISEESWSIACGSILDKNFMKKFKKFDFVYSWGVLHHTGDMLNAIKNSMAHVKPNGFFCIAIYNNQGIKSSFWKLVKKFYCTNKFCEYLIKVIFIPLFFLQALLSGLIKNRNPFYFLFNYRKKRGMSFYFDCIDWLGGYPFEVASSEIIIKLFEENNFTKVNLIETNGLGCNQFLFFKN